MPKQRITKEMVVNAAFEIARSSGMEQVMVKNIADKIGCSVQPIYSYCKNMDGLRTDVVEQTNIFIRQYISEHIDKENLFASTGREYVLQEGRISVWRKKNPFCSKYSFCIAEPEFLH